MLRVSMKAMMRAIARLEERGRRATLLGIGPMSETVIEAALRLAGEKDFPVMFIASRNQVDSDEFGRGYVRRWNQADFAGAVRDAAGRVGFDGLCHVCRDHGGPWQRDKERADRLPPDEAMDIAKRSFVADMKAGFDLLHIDPTKDPHAGPVMPLALVLDRTVELIAHVESERIRLGLPEIAYEVGTEETNGGLTGESAYADFIERLARRLNAQNLPLPLFIVGQTGTLTRLTENVGRFDPRAARTLSEIARSHGVGLKEHNGDYLSDAMLAMHPGLGVSAVNVAPEFGVVETVAFLALSETEQRLAALGLLGESSSFGSALSLSAVRSERWRKWLVGVDAAKPVEEALSDKSMADLITRVGGHYCFDHPDVRKAMDAMAANLASLGIKPARLVLGAIQRAIGRYADCFGLEGLTGEIRGELAAG